MTALTSILVGAFHRPPAKQVLECLPTGQPLLLIPEPENPYDREALRVLVEPGTIPVELHDMLRDKLAGTGTELEDLLMQPDPLQLGFVVASEGKPLAKAREASPMPLVGNREFNAERAEHSEATAKLAFGPDGKALVMLSWQEQSA